ncbi:MAG TPA: toprim domain-containing protein, partial [Candidatus Bathyarchaeia archaeon]|nr:toprim domain-containing protein [Candidatus Bathyarchaeia archaeon]
KQGRDRNFQAILPLRGKILNVEKARIDKMLTSQEIKNLIIAMGTGVGDQANIDKMRYHRVIIMTDADVDGSHIRTLLLTFFYRNFEEIIKRGYLYIAAPPLYRISKGKEVHYAYNDEDKAEIIEEFLKKKIEKQKIAAKAKKKSEIKEEGEEISDEEKKSGVNVQRYKGLGEMNPSQLWETTMDPANRVMYQVNVEDAVEADKIFNILMGSEVEPRKRFIQAEARSVVNLDV